MPTLFVATIGGHLVELVQIASRLPDDGDDVRVWATQDHPQSRSLLAGEKVIFVPEVGERDVPGVAAQPALRAPPASRVAVHACRFDRFGDRARVSPLPRGAGRVGPLRRVRDPGREPVADGEPLGRGAGRAPVHAVGTPGPRTMALRRLGLRRLRRRGEDRARPNPAGSGVGGDNARLRLPQPLRGARPPVAGRRCNRARAGIARRDALANGLYPG